MARDTIEPADVRLPPTAVFVDETGRKRRRARLAGWIVAAVAGLYFVLLAASVVRAPWVPQVALPGVGSVLPTPGPRLAPALGPAAVVTPAPDVTSPRPTASTVPTTVTLPSTLAVTEPATAAPDTATSSTAAVGRASPPPTAATGRTLPTPSSTPAGTRPTPSSVVPPGHSDTTVQHGRGRP